MEEWIKILAPYVPLMQTFLWVALIGIGIKVFYTQCCGLLDAVKSRVISGSSLKAGPIELGADLRKLDYVEPKAAVPADAEAKSGDKSYLQPMPDKNEFDWVNERNRIYEDTRGVFLVHVIEPAKNPQQQYDIFVFLVRHKSNDFADISHAEFFFGHYWGNNVFREESKAGLIGVSTSAYGPFLCLCRVTFNDGFVANVYRYIDFEMGRVFENQTK